MINPLPILLQFKASQNFKGKSVQNNVVTTKNHHCLISALLESGTASTCPHTNKVDFPALRSRKVLAYISVKKSPFRFYRISILEETTRSLEVESPLTAWEEKKRTMPNLKLLPLLLTLGMNFHCTYQMLFVCH